MGNFPSVVPKGIVSSPVTTKPYLNAGMVSFTPSTTAFLNAYTASVATWMAPSPATNLGLVATLTKNDWATRLKSLGATTDEPIYRFASAYFNPLALPDLGGVRAPVTTPDVLYIGRRTRAVASVNTVTFSTNTAGTVRVRVNPAKYIHASTTPAGSLADVTITADGVLTPTQLATALQVALMAVTGFAASFTAVAALGVVTITDTTDNPGSTPLVIDVMPTTPGPTMELKVTTANTPGDYADDLDDIQTAAELGSQLDPPSRKWFFISDIQADDAVDLEGMGWVDDQKDTDQFNPPRRYMFNAWSSTGNKAILIGTDQVGNFAQAATASLAQNARAANANEGYTNGAVHDHDRYEFIVGALWGRTIGYLPGETSFTSRPLFGSTANAQMTGRDYGDDESLADIANRSFSWYSAEGAQGSHKYGATSAGSFIDRPWLEAYAEYLAFTDLVAWMQRKNITAFDDDTIIAGAGIISAALAKLPAIDPNTIVVTYQTRAQVNPSDIAIRVYKGYAGFSVTFGIINQIGTLAEPFTLNMQDAG